MRAVAKFGAACILLALGAGAASAADLIILTNQGATPMSMNPSEFTAYLNKDIEKVAGQTAKILN